MIALQQRNIDQNWDNKNEYFEFDIIIIIRTQGTMTSSKSAAELGVSYHMVSTSRQCLPTASIHYGQGHASGA